MDRRDFLKVFTAASVAAGIGFPLAFAPKGKYSIRYVEMYDVHSDKMLHRIDMATGGLELEIPMAVPRGIAYHNVEANRILDACDLMRSKVTSIPPRKVLSAFLEKELDRQEIFAITWH